MSQTPKFLTLNIIKSDNLVEKWESLEFIELPNFHKWKNNK